MKAQITKLLSELHEKEWAEKALTDEDVWKVMSQPNTLLLTHEEDGRVVGMCLMLVFDTFTARYAVIPEITVLKEFSGQNILRELFGRAVEKAKQAECDALQVYTRNSEQKAKAIFKKGGFVNGVWSVMTLNLKKDEK